MQALTFSCGALYPELPCAHTSGIVDFQGFILLYEAWYGHVILLTCHKWSCRSASAFLTILSQMIAFLSIKQTPAVEREKSRTPRGNLQQESSPTQRTDVCVSATFASKYGSGDKCTYLEVPLIWQRKSHITEVIFLEPPLRRWAEHRGEFWVIAHLNNAKCVLLCTREAQDAKWLGWQGRADEMLRHESLSMFLFPPCALVVSEWNSEEVCVFLWPRTDERKTINYKAGSQSGKTKLNFILRLILSHLFPFSVNKMS